MSNIFDLNILSCPGCRGNLRLENNQLICGQCQSVHLIIDGIPILLPKTSLDNPYEMDYIDHYKQDAEIFNYFEERECKATEHDEKRLREYISSKIPKHSNIILDVGSGGAWFAKKFSAKGKNVISFDIAEKNIREALKNFKSKHHFGVVGDALNPPFAENSIDCIVTSEVIEHIVDPKKFVQCLIKLVKPGGLLIISTPYKEILHYSQCIHCNRQTPKNAHLHSFDENSLFSLAENEMIDDQSYYIFGNKALTIMRTHVILKHFPFSLWKITDKLSNILINKPAHIIVSFTKKNHE